MASIWCVDIQRHKKSDLKCKQFEMRPRKLKKYFKLRKKQIERGEY